MLGREDDDPSMVAVSTVGADRLKAPSRRLGFGWPGPARLAGTIVTQLLRDRERWPLWLPVGLGTGIAAYFALPAEPAAWLAPVILALLMLAGLALRRRPWSLALVLALASLALGVSAASLRSHLVAAPILGQQSKATTVTARVVAVEPHVESAGGARVILTDALVAGLEPAATPARLRIRLTKRDPARLAPGDLIRLRAVLRPPPEPAAPGAFDFARQAYFKRLGAVGFAVGHSERLPDPTEAVGQGLGETLYGSLARELTQGLAGMRQAIAERVLAQVSGAPGGVAAALMTGERSAIPEAVMEDMRASGLAHLLAISGLHVGLVAGLIFFAVRALLALVPRLALDHPIKKWAAVTSFLAALFYLLLVGATVPTQRAFLMVSVVLLAVLIDRTAISLRLVAWAAIVVLLLAPESLLSASFQMSFAAVTGLVAAWEALRDRRPLFFSQAGPARRLGLYLAGVAFTSLIAVCATGPFAAYHFNRIAVFGLLANLVAVPLTAFAIMPLAVLALLLMPLGLEGPVLQLVGWCIAALLAVAAGVADWPSAVVTVPAMPPLGLALTVAGGLWLCLWRFRWRLFGLPVIALGLASIAVADPPDVLVSRDAGLMAVRDDRGTLWLSSLKRQRFGAGIWLRRAGEEEGKVWPARGEAAEGQLRCDPWACLFHTDGRMVSLVRDPMALEEDCRTAALLVSREPLRGLPCAAQVIDRFDVWRAGAHAVWLEDGEIRVESVAERRGNRPWSPSKAAQAADPQ